MVSSKYNFNRSLLGYFNKAKEIYEKEGLTKLLSDIINHTYGRVFDLWYNSKIREQLPVTGHVKYNQVIIAKKKLGDEFLFPQFFENNPTLEEQYVKYIRNFVASGESVNIIGGRYGVSTVAAGKAVGENGSVTTFEATTQGCEQLKKTVKLNNLEGRVNVVQAVIGSAVSIEVEDENKKVGDQVYDCDILAIDCDGCELDVLQNISTKPELLIIEHHPVNITDDGKGFEYDREKLDSIITSKGYTIISSHLEDNSYHCVAEINGNST